VAALDELGDHGQVGVGVAVRGDADHEDVGHGGLQEQA
jgi:predicted NBD/HSP70 family sugar kinase